MSTEDPAPVPAPDAGADAPSVIVDNPDAPTLPEASSQSELLEAVGAKPRPTAGRNRRPESLEASSGTGTKDEDEDETDDEANPGRKRLWFVVAIAGLLGATIAAFVLLGRSNSDQYELVCLPDKIVAEQGRTFPPWGMRPMSGPEWKPIEIPPNAECQHHETENPTELAGWYFDALQARAVVLLSGEATKIDLAEQQLNQALLFVRAPTQKAQREGIERLLGDVVYWRASAKLRDATTGLVDAAKQFDAAAAQRPRIASDASAWANYIRKLADELHVGPKGVATSFPPIPPAGDHPDRPVPPAGVALPVEGAGSAKVEIAPAVPPDAGVPSGGVLL